MLFLSAALRAQQKPAALPAGYAGAAACRSCHTERTHSFQANPHAAAGAVLAAERQAGRPPVVGCEACHGPGQAHVTAMEAAGGSDAAVAAGLRQHPIGSFAPGSAAVLDSQPCLGCHQGRRETEHFAHSAHADNKVVCLSCHSIHAARTVRTLLRAAQPALCYQCHVAQKAQFNLPFHHRVNEGLVRCSDCHNPHGSFIPTQLRTAAAQDQVCFTCHEDKQGPFVFEHEPVKTEGCLDCHSPHGSPNPHLLTVANVNQLCLQCHTASSFSGAPGTPSFHNQATQFQACTLCHTQIHGSNLDPAFTR